ncbi:hypothetical protein ACWGQT_07420 [Streptomyces yangpuensis]
MTEEQRDCQDKATRTDHVCSGYVTGRESHAGTGTIIYRCAAGHRAAEEWHEQHLQRYPDSPIPPAWFDPTAAGERWNDED